MSGLAQTGEVLQNDVLPRRHHFPLPIARNLRIKRPRFIRAAEPQQRMGAHHADPAGLRVPLPFNDSILEDDRLDV
jgi:hypothetical protein